MAQATNVLEVPTGAVIDENFLPQCDPPLTVASRDELSVLGLVELILKRRDRLDALIRDPSLQPHLMPRLLAIALVAFLLYGVAESLVLSAAGGWPRLRGMTEDTASHVLWEFPRPATPEGMARPWLDGTAWAFLFAYTFGLIGASGICLPALYFHGLLAGVRLKMLDVVLHTVKSKATAAVALIGILPVYAALALGIVIFPVTDNLRNPVLWLGLLLPFIAGLWGTWSLYRGFVRLADTLADDCRGRRACLLRRLVGAWAACYTAVTPVLIYTLWQRLG